MPAPAPDLVEIEAGWESSIFIGAWGTWHMDWEWLRSREFLHLEKVIMVVLHYQMVGGLNSRQSPILPSWERQVTYRHICLLEKYIPGLH